MTASYAEVELARRLAPLPRPLLLVGQSGVGKGLLARFVHVHSARAGAFVAVAGGELSESLLHDPLAGNEAGASPVRSAACEGRS